ncbi:uncharacterized protein [Amphiura filiformis]|uniref:uncharacterized protein n=1 Tax=Amphiura filiformis TaxID=82378 RepID=UPI003B211787
MGSCKTAQICLILALLVRSFGGVRAQGDWQLVFRAVAGVSRPDPYDVWVTDTALNENQPNACKLTDDFQGHYKSSAALRRNWNAQDIIEVRVALYTSESLVREIIFDGRGSDITSWFSESNLIRSSWTDLTSSTTDFQFFSIEGDYEGLVTRHFYMFQGAYMGCEVDQAWFAMITEPGVCYWDRVSGQTHPYFTYSNQPTKAAVQAGGSAISSDISFADVFAIFIKHRSAAAPLSINCMDSCTIDESGGVIYLEVTVGPGFATADRRRRRRRSLISNVNDKGYVVNDAHERSKRAGAFFHSIVVETFKGPGNTADGVLDYGPIFLETARSVTIPIEIVDDLLVEGDETFTVEISPFVIGSGSTSEAYEVTVTIKDNDVLPPPEVLVPVFTLDKFLYHVIESAGAVTITVRRLVDTSKQQNIDSLATLEVHSLSERRQNICKEFALKASTSYYKTTPIDAITPKDYNGSPITLTFQPGDEEQSYSISIVNDDIVE